MDKACQYRAHSKQRKARLALGRTQQEDYTCSYKAHTFASYPFVSHGGRENDAERRYTVYGKLSSGFVVQAVDAFACTKKL